MRGRPSCLLQSAGGEANRILLASAIGHIMLYLCIIWAVDVKGWIRLCKQLWFTLVLYKKSFGWACPNRWKGECVTLKVVFHAVISQASVTVLQPGEVVNGTEPPCCDVWRNETTISVRSAAERKVTLLYIVYYIYYVLCPTAVIIYYIIYYYAYIVGAIMLLLLYMHL